MTPSRASSAAASRLARKGPLTADEAAFMSLAGKSARQTSFRPIGARLGASRFISRQQQRSPDRKASRDRRRMLGGSSALPDNLRPHYTEGQRAVLCIVAGEVKRTGNCDLPLDKIAALAGVCRTTVQTTLHEGRRVGHLRITERPRRGRKSLTNVVEILSREWLAWIERAPSAARLIGSSPLKIVSPTKSREEDDTAREASEEAFNFAKELATIAGHERGQEPKPWREADAPRIVQGMLDKLRARSSILVKRPPIDILRQLTVEIAKRRAAVGDAPRSPRYFEAAVNRTIAEWDLALAGPCGPVRNRRIA